MPYILDAIIIFTVLFFVFLSAKKGFTFTLIETVGFIAAIVITFNVSAPAANAVYDNFIEKPVINKIEATQNEAETAVVDVVWNKMPKFIIENEFLSPSKEDIKIVNTDDNLAEKISDSLIKPVFTKITSIVISVVMFAVLIFIVKFLAKYINKLFSFSIVGDINKVLGGVLGLVKGIAVSLIICLVAGLILSFTKDGFFIFKYDIINSTYIFKYLMEFLPI